MILSVAKLLVPVFYSLFLLGANEAPVMTDYEATIEENLKEGTVIGTLDISDPEGDGLTFWIDTGNVEGAFDIDEEMQLLVTNSAALDFETTPVFDMRVFVHDSEGNETYGQLTVRLADVDESSCWGGTGSEPGEDFVLIWADEFDEDGAICDENWFHQTRLPNGESWFNGELQHYTDRLENSIVEDGLLKITARKEAFTDQGITKQYTSARLNSKVAFEKGKVEVRAKLPTGLGTWPAIWTLGQNITENGGFWADQFGTVGWPTCGEIDIMEHWGFNQDVIQAATHTPSSFGATINKGSINGDDVSNTFHTYSMIWGDDYIEFYYDDIKYYTYQPDEINDSTWPFEGPQYLLLNIAMGGVGGDIDPNFTQSSMEIDYVRIYQKNDYTRPQNSPLVEAPAPLRRASSDVIAIFSDSFDELPSIGFNPNWGQQTQVRFEKVNNDEVLVYDQFNYQGIDLNQVIDLSDFEYLHVDVWTPDAAVIEVSPVSPSSQPIEVLQPLLPLVRDEWNSYDIPLQDFVNGGMSLENIQQIKFDGQKGDTRIRIILDNIYFYKGEGRLLSNMDESVYVHEGSIMVNDYQDRNYQVLVFDFTGKKLEENTLSSAEFPYYIQNRGLLIILVKDENIQQTRSFKVRLD